MTTTADVFTETSGDVAWVTLNRPERYNAYDDTMAHAVVAAINDAADAGVIVITGTGKGFCAGGTLSSDAGLDEAGMRRLYRSSILMFDAIRMSPRPVIAAVNGAAAGGGNELVVACDLAVAASRATFGQTGPRIGSAPVTGGTNLLAMQVGEKRAKEISFMCRRYTADEALAMGLVNRVVPDEELVAETTRWADELLALSPRYLEIAKVSSNVWWNQARDSFLSGVGMLTQAIGSDDMVEGMRAFSEKRPPRFRERGAGE
jgi:2-ketocyclohexanecarboxyl-CoA hydrolase